MNTPGHDRLPHPRQFLTRAMKILYLLGAGIIFCLVLGMPGKSFAQPEKVDVCHRPPDNPSNSKIIRIPATAVSSHLAHGDHLVGPEVCDGIDNDCNGVVDEGVPNIVTGSDVGECRPEIQACISGEYQVIQAGINPIAEICDALDNNCNGLLDDGISPIVTGSDVGACQPEIQECQGGQFVVTQAAIEPTTETCDAIDNDCDGQVDEDLLLVSDTPNEGACRPGILECQAGQFVVIQTAIEPTTEICNNIDDDCDGTIDEGLDQVETGTDVGECRKGISECQDGVLVEVQAEIGSSPEICDGLDNDCDGTTDGAAANADCNDGISCTNDACISGTCTNTADDSQCNEALVCDPNLGCILDREVPGDPGGGCNRLVCSEPPDVGPPVAEPPGEEPPVVDPGDDPREGDDPRLGEEARLAR